MNKINLIPIFVILFFSACEKPLEKETGFIKAGKLTIYYEAQGEGQPILLLHAWLQDHRMWQPQMDVLKTDYRVIAIDLPGQGKTSGNDTTILIADVLIKVLDDLEVDRVTVIGLSDGSLTATDLVLAYPERVNQVVLVSPGLIGWQNAIEPDSLSMHYVALVDSAFLKEDDTATAEIFTKAWCDGPFRKPEEVRKDVRDYIQTTALENLRQHKADSWSNFSKTTEAGRVEQIKNPVLLVYGDKDIPLTGTVSHFLHRSIKGSKEVKIPGVAHMLNMEVPEEFNKILMDFLE